MAAQQLEQLRRSSPGTNRLPTRPDNLMSMSDSTAALYESIRKSKMAQDRQQPSAGNLHGAQAQAAEDELMAKFARSYGSNSLQRYPKDDIDRFVSTSRVGGYFDLLTLFFATLLDRHPNISTNMVLEQRIVPTLSQHKINTKQRVQEVVKTLWKTSSILIRAYLWPRTSSSRRVQQAEVCLHNRPQVQWPTPSRDVPS